VKDLRAFKAAEVRIIFQEIRAYLAARTGHQS